VKGLPLVGVGVFILAAVLGVIVWQKSQVRPQVAPPKESGSEFEIKQVDLSTQPEWVQKLQVTAKRGVSPNGLDNVTVSVKGIDKSVESLTYVLQYDTVNRGSQGALSTSPLMLNGKVDWIKSIDLGTCSTKSCVRHDGVKSVDIELNFTSSDDSTSTWTGSLSL
jgi:hypothetical protein